MIERILKALNRNESTEIISDMWKWCYSYSTRIEINEKNLENMANNELVFGFLGYVNNVNENVIPKLATALGILGVQNPESGKNPIPLVNLINYSDLELLKKINDVIGFDITFPPFIGGKTTIDTDYGIVTERHCHYLWLVKRILELCPDRDSAIIEIGAGIGLLGYYLDRLGYKDYTVIDLARTGACQTYFLWKNIPYRNFILSGEKKNPFDLEYKDSIKLLHSSDFVNIPKNRFNLMINIDGLTEMEKEEAFNYVDNECSSVLLSINHEMNDYRICELNTRKKLKYRYPFWIRDGYIEELYADENK